MSQLEKKYIKKRLQTASFHSILFYLNRIFPIKKRKIVFCSIEGTTGYMCNPKYVAEQFIKENQNLPKKERWELVWLVNDINKKFPKEIRVVKNTLWNRAYELSTAKVWIENSRKQLEVRKRKGQLYIQMWHGKMSFKPIGLDRGKLFPKIAYIVSKHDSDMIDYVISNSKWFEDMAPTGLVYQGKTVRLGSPRCDILLHNRESNLRKIRQKYHLPKDSKILLYAPTFRAGSQGTNRSIDRNQTFPNYEKLLKTLEEKFGGTWYIFLRFHPQIVARNLDKNVVNSTNNLDGRVIDISREEDLYEILAGCDSFLTDYSSAAFDAMVMKIPIFLFIDDYKEYVAERGKLMWNLDKLPFLYGANDDELLERIEEFDRQVYNRKLEQLFCETELVEDGNAAKKVFQFIQKKVK